MVLANTSAGLTRAFDLTNPADLSSLQSLLSSDQVTALALQREGIVHYLLSPRGLGRPVFGAELLAGSLGERVFAQARDLRVSLTWTFSSNVVRTDLVRTGTMRYNPRA